MADNDSVKIIKCHISSSATDLLLSKIKPEDSNSPPRVLPSRTNPVLYPRHTPGLVMNSQTGAQVPPTPRFSSCYIPSRQNPIRMPSSHLPGVGFEGFPVVSHMGCPAGLLLPEAISRSAAYGVFTNSALHSPAAGGSVAPPPVPTCPDRLPVDLSTNRSRSISNHTEGSSPSVQSCKSSTPVMTVTTTATNGLPTAFTPIACRTSLLPRASAHGVIKHLSSAASVLEKVRLKALPDLSSALQLDPSVVLGDNQPQNSTPPGPAAPVANASASETLEAPLSVVSKEHKSRKGLHVCLYCDRTFSNASLFASHVKRPVARVVYRCHLCSLSPGAGGLPRDTVVVPALNPDARGGMLSASNLCALYVHMAICHAAEPVSNWRLVPSRLSVCALSSAAWEDQTPMPPLTNRGTASAAAAGATPSHRSDETPTQAAWESVAEETVLSTSARPIVIDLEEGSDEESEESRLRHQQQNAFPIYSPGQELTDVWNDVERSVWAQLPFSECTFLPPTPGFRSALRQPDVPLMALNAVNGALDPPPPPPTSAATIPWPDTPQAHHLLRLAESPVWQGQYFLCGWQCEPPTPSPSAVNMPADAPPPRISRPVAPSSEQLLSALRALNCALSQKPANEASPTLSSSSSTAPTCTASPAEVGSVLVSKSSSSADRWISLLCPRDTGTGCVSALRCLLCNFRTNSPAELAHHLSGPPAGTTSTTPTRCALCSQSVACNQATASFCSMKAHLLFHLGIFLTCPQCGFTPPPTLTPDLAELCLRLHLRFVCFHFNVVQKYLCSWPVCWKRTFTSLQNFIKHWVECHTASRFACLLCSKDASRDPDVKLATGDHAVNGSTNGPADGTRTSEASRILGHTTPAGAFKFADESSVVKHLRADHQVAEQHLASHSKEFYTTGHICSHCSLVCSSSLDLANHFTGTHCRILSSGSSSSSGCGANVASGGSAGPTPCESQCYFCCFNGCRRIYASAEELRQHLSSCPLAYRDLSVTFGRALNCQPPAPTNEMVAPLAADSTDLQKPNPLCFCLYCGVGVGKRTRGTGTVTPHQQVSDQQALISIDQSEDADAPAATSFPVQLEANTGDSSRPASSSNSANEAPSASPAGAPSALAPPVPVNCASAFFPTISSLHAHERGHISYGGSGQIGCPWCGERLAYARFEDIQNILDHLFSHARDNRYVVWHLNRRKLQKKHPEEFLQCYCGAALDCPLAVCAHATQLPDRLEVDCPLTAYLRPVCEAASAYERTHQANEVGKLASTTAGGRSSETAKDGGGGGTGAGPKSATPDLCCRTSVIRSPLLPASHAPISVRVFDHLRFAVRPELDPLMSAFGAGSRGAFRCPICLSVEPTRWLLTEHAFTRHWTRLCYVCCRHEHQDSNDQHAGPDFRPSHFEHSDQMKEGNTADPSDSPSSSHGNAVPQPPRSTNTSDFWQHVFDCMLSRHLALLKAESASTVAYEATDEADSVTATDEMLATDQEMEGAETDEDEEEVMESDQGEANAAVAEPLSSPPASARSLTEVAEPPRMGLSSSLSVSLGTTDRTSVRSSSAASRIVMSASSESVPTAATSTVAVSTSPTISHSPNKSSSVLSLATSCETSQPSKMPRLEPSTPAVTPVLKTSPTTASVPTLSPQVPPPEQPSCTGTASTAPPSGGRFGKAISVPINEDPEGMRTHRICIVCGKKCTWDTYEEHMLEHRSPLLDWRGPLHDPARNNVPRERRTIYRCNVCERRFLQRTSCARHMLHFHKIERTALNWDDLVETLGNELLVNAPNTTRLPTFASRMPFEFPQQTTTPPGSRNGATSGPTLLSCAFCSAQFKNRKQLRQHVLVTHPSPEGSIWLPCPDCGLQFLSKKSLKIHTRGTHHRSLLTSEDGLQPEVPEIL